MLMPCTTGGGTNMLLSSVGASAYPMEQGECNNLSSLCLWLYGIPAQRSFWRSYNSDSSHLHGIKYD